jgi:hypothetical protein
VRHPFPLGRADLGFEVGDDHGGDLVEDVEQVLHIPIEPISPPRGTRLGLRELDRDPQPIAGEPDGATDDVSDAELLPELGDRVTASAVAR